MNTIQDLDHKRALFGLMAKEFRRRRRDKGSDYFTPNAPQLKTLKSKAKITILCAGNRVGKSSLGAFELSVHMTRSYDKHKCPCHGDWFSMERRFGKPIKAVVVATEFPIIERTIEPKIMSFLPKVWIKKVHRTPQGYLRRIDGTDGGSVDILTNEMDQLAFESADWSYAWCDEPTSRNRFVAIRRGLVDSNGLMTLTFTPIVEPWMKEHLVDKSDGVHIDTVRASSYENLSDIHNNPILVREAFLEFEKDLPEEERRTRILGEFFHLRGLCYTEYDPSVHEKLFNYQYPDPVICVLDPHDRKKHHMIWAFVDRQDHVFVDSELVINATTQELKKAILAHEQIKGYKMRRRLIDPNFSHRPLLSTGRTLLSDLALPPFPVKFSDSNDSETEGILKVQDYLHFDRKRPLDLTNSPKVWFHRERVPKTIHSIKNLQYSDWKGKSKEEKDPKERVQEKDDDGADCMRYLLMSNPHFDRLSKVYEDSGLLEAVY